MFCIDTSEGHNRRKTFANPRFSADQIDSGSKRYALMQLRLTSAEKVFVAKSRGVHCLGEGESENCRKLTRKQCLLTRNGVSR